MPSKKKRRDTVPMSSMAGLIRYYEEEKEVVKVSPKVLLISSVILVAAVIAITKLLPVP
jgi:preprotein translocase subunit Sec61beta